MSDGTFSKSGYEKWGFSLNIFPKFKLAHKIWLSHNFSEILITRVLNGSRNAPSHVDYILLVCVMSSVDLLWC